MGAGAVRAVLEELRLASGAERAAWVGGPHGSLFAGGPRGARGLGCGWTAGLAPPSGSRSLRLGPGPCARRPRLAAAGLRHVAVLDFDAGRRLVLAGREELSLKDRGLDTVGRVLSALEAKRALEQERARLQALAARGLGAAGAAHDLRNVLATASLECEALGADRCGTAEAVRLRETLAAAGALARDFLETEQAPARERVRLAPIVAREARAAAEPRGVSVAVSCAENLEAVGRRDLLARIVRNLAANAAEASPRGAELEVTARSEGARQVALEVADTGRGMDASELELLLEPGRSQSGGTGFGSASILQCLARVGGELRIDSEPGEGTRCRVTLRRAPEEAIPLVLVHDDDDRARRAWCGALDAAGLESVGVQEARESRAWIRGGLPAALLLARGAPGGEALRPSALERGLPLFETGVLSDWPSLPSATALERIARLVGAGS